MKKNGKKNKRNGKKNLFLGASLELAFWTIWASRWAKENPKEIISSKNKICGI
jgi:lambda repressor-like predicted transcriptional regulator